MLLQRLDRQVINPPNKADAIDELCKLVERDSSLVTTILDHSYKGATVLRVWTECNLGQRR
jgi:hypothetical protein